MPLRSLAVLALQGETLRAHHDISQRQGFDRLDRALGTALRSIFIGPDKVAVLEEDPVNTPYTLSINTNRLRGRITGDAGSSGAPQHFFASLDHESMPEVDVGLRVRAVRAHYTIGVANATVAVIDIRKSTYPIVTGTAPTGAVVPSTGTGLLTQDDHRVVETITTPLTIDRDIESVLVDLAITIANTTTLDFWGMWVDYEVIP